MGSKDFKSRGCGRGCQRSWGFGGVWVELKSRGRRGWGRGAGVRVWVREIELGSGLGKLGLGGTGGWGWGLGSGVRSWVGEVGVGGGGGVGSGRLGLGELVGIRGVEVGGKLGSKELE